MRFVEDGPSIPDELLVARDAGDVIFFCGAGVSRARANLPDFLTLGRQVLDLLGAGKESLACKLFEKAEAIGGMDGVGGLIATDRIFSLLEREFEVADVRAAVAKAITPVAGVDCSAHRILLDLSTSKDGKVRLVTTNFDLLFEACDDALGHAGPPVLPDPRSQTFGGIIHLHGRVDAGYGGPDDDEFVVSSGDFGRAYLSDGWATRFMQSLLARFQIVFVGYTADDPPMQYLLEALRLRAGGRNRLYAFQEGLSTDSLALWEHRGVQAIPFDKSLGYGPLWDTLEAWAERAKDVEGWYASLLGEAAKGPDNVSPHVRGQIAHMFSTREGSRRIAMVEPPIPATWLLTMDARHRYGRPGSLDPNDESSDRFDPYELLALDSDVPPEPINEDGYLAERKVPEGSWDAFAPTRADQEDNPEQSVGTIRGQHVSAAALMPPRLWNIALWLQRVAHDPITLWWAAQQRHGLHPRIIETIETWLGQDPARFPDAVRRGWRVLFAAWGDQRSEPDRIRYDIARRIMHEGWSGSIVRSYADIFKPQLEVKDAFGIRHPLTWKAGEPTPAVLHLDVDYPHPHELLDVPDEQLGYAVGLFRHHLELARALEAEIRDNDWLHFETTRADDGAQPIGHNSYGLTGPIAHYQTLVGRLGDVDREAARAEIAAWSTDNDGIFTRLRIWAAGSTLTTLEEALQTFLGLSDLSFWGGLHQRDLLYAIRDRWAEMSHEQRRRLEERLRTGSYPWKEDAPETRARRQAKYRLDRFEWLSREGIEFSFDLAAEMSALQVEAPEWTQRMGAEAAASHAPVVHSVETDTDPARLEAVALADILTEAKSAEHEDFWDFVERRPFSGLADKEPARAFGALRITAKKGEVPGWAWSTFLDPEKRKGDPVRLVRAIAAQLGRLTSEQLHAIAFPISDWMAGLAERLYGDLSDILAPLWDRIIEALQLGGPVRNDTVDSSWANDALNAPVGRLHRVLMRDPEIQNRPNGSGLPVAWAARAEQLLSLPGDMLRHALVMIGFHAVWMHPVDPEWTERHLLTFVDREDSDGDALWDGILWRARPPTRAMFERIKGGLVKRAANTMRRRSEAIIMGGFLLIGWGGNEDADEPEQLIASEEFRRILVEGDDDLRSQVLWQLQQWMQAPDGRWRGRVLGFFRDVWPHHRALRTPEISGRLADFAFESGNMFPDVVVAILTRLVPIRGGFSRLIMTEATDENHPARRYPQAMLDLLWAVLAEDASQWPYKVEDVLEILEAASETMADPRMSELRRRRSR